MPSGSGGRYDWDHKRQPRTPSVLTPECLVALYGRAAGKLRQSLDFVVTPVTQPASEAQRLKRQKIVVSGACFDCPPWTALRKMCAS
jgi:hypothetical protein